MSNFEYIDLPPIPEFLWPEIYLAIDNNQSYSTPTCTTYSICEATKNLYDFVSTIFDPEIYTYNMVNVQQFIDNGIKHIDSRRNLTYNFLIDQGNPTVTTNWYRDQADTVPYESHVIEPLRWHRLKVDGYHQVAGFRPGDRRLAVCVFESFKHTPRLTSL